MAHVGPQRHRKKKNCYEMKECWEGNGCDTKTSFTTFLLDPRKFVMHYILIMNWLHG